MNGGEQRTLVRDGLAAGSLGSLCTQNWLVKEARREKFVFCVDDCSQNCGQLLFFKLQVSH